jgi:hypothetical protein
LLVAVVVVDKLADQAQVVIEQEHYRSDKVLPLQSAQVARDLLRVQAPLELKEAIQYLQLLLQQVEHRADQVSVKPAVQVQAQV